MDVWLSTIGQRLDHADNTRTMLLARFLIEADHTVTLWTSAYDHIRKEWRREWIAAKGAPLTMPNGLTVRFMKGCGYRRNIGLRRLIDHLLAARDFRRQAELLRAPDIVVASLPDHITASEMVRYARHRDIPAIVDVRDKWPDVFHDYAPRLAKPVVRAALTVESRRARRTLAGASVLVAMMKSMLEWGLEKAGRTGTADDRIFYLSTMEAVTTAAAPLSNLPDDSGTLLESLAGKMVFTFVGTFNRTQHPLLAIEAFERLVQRSDFPADGVALLVGGDGEGAEEVDRRLAALPCGHGLGWLKPDEMRAILVRSDVGLLPLNFPSPAFNNKAFAYLAAGIPIVNCALGDLADLIDQEHVGLNVRGGDVAGFAEAIRTLAGDRARVEGMKERTRALFARSFDQRSTYRDYVEHIVRVSRDYAAQAG